jgi:hypothetical protein
MPDNFFMDNQDLLFRFNQLDVRDILEISRYHATTRVSLLRSCAIPWILPPDARNLARFA